MVHPKEVLTTERPTDPLKRHRPQLCDHLARAVEIPPTVLLLSSDASSFVIGSVLVVDGRHTLM